MPAKEKTPTKEAVEALVRRIVELVHPSRVVLFGSAAREEAGPRSDVDLLVVMAEDTHRRKTAEYLYRNLKGTGVDFDLVVATSTDLERYGSRPGLVYRSALAEGKELYATMPCRCDTRLHRSL